VAPPAPTPARSTEPGAEAPGAEASGAAADESPVERPWPVTDATSRAGEPFDTSVEETRSWPTRRPPPEALDVEAELPPSRTHRQRPTAPSEDIADLLRPRPTTSPRETEGERELEHRVPEPRRGRGRGRSSPRSTPERPPEPMPPERTAEPPEIEVPHEPVVEDRIDAGRRRGGRSAIRARGGDREPLAERPRVPAPMPDREVEPDRPRRERTPAEGEAERPRRDRDRPRGPERPRPPETDAPRERHKPHTRAGEPGYVPRRERTRLPEPPIDSESPTLIWSDVEPEDRDREEEEIDRSLSIDPEETDLLDEAGGPASKLDGPRRRRRRRGRRRGRDDQEREPGAAGPDDELEIEEEPPSIPPRAARRALEPAPTGRDEFDFDDESHDDDFVGPPDVDDEIITPAPDEDIDPELEEEIRREAEEIAELEREMGLRGPVEARPRRGDDRAEGAEPMRAPGRSARGRGLIKPPIQDIFRRGDEVLIQVIKESIGTKGPTLSTYISIPGRYLVLMPGLNRVGVSRKIADEGQRRKLREIMNDLNPPKGLGFIVRTAGLDRTKRELARDLAYLLRLWKVILRRIKKAKTPAPIYQESDMITRTIRDIFSSDIDTIWIDEPAAFERAQEFLRIVMPKFVDRLKFYDGKVPLFHKYGIEDEIAKIQRRRIDLPHGGSIVIDQTEALVAIDVNSGNFRVENDAERTAYEMNIRAAKEIARQLRLRDLGGVICNDFIDMRDERNRRGVEKALRDAVKRDRARTKVLRMSQFGILEMTRQRIRPSLKRSVYEDCPHCTGAGVVKTVESMSIDVMRLMALAAHREEIRRVNVTVSGPVATHLNNKKRRDITRLETDANMTIHIRHEDHVPAEHLQIDCFDAQNNEIRLTPAPPALGPPPRRGR
jgi:ribonuclease E